MSTLYIDRKDCELKIQGKSLVCFFNGKRQRPVPLEILERIVIASNIQLNSQLLIKLADAGIATTFINPRKANQRAMLTGVDSKNPRLRILQYQASLDKKFKQRIAKSLILAKTKNHLRLYQQIQEKRPELRYPITKAVKELQQITQRLKDKDSTLETLRGIEGNAAKVAFGAYQHLFADSLEFTGRKRRPPPDPVNVCLSLAYTLTYYRAAHLAYGMGLDPMIGFLHEVQYSRDSLAADLIEPWRPHLEEWVYHLFQQRELRAEHFTKNGSSCLLGKTGRHTFFSAYETQQKILTRAIRLQLRGFIKTLKNEYENQPSLQLSN
jgi:CRISPR-associated protein Cas1